LIFIDTGFLFALFVEGDLNHERVREVFKEFRSRRLDQLLVTTITS
jgi:predicted nucleic acid-binding protein